MKLIPPPLDFGPFSQLLGKAAVKRILSVSKGQAQPPGNLTLGHQLLLDIRASDVEKFLQCQPFPGGIGVKGKRNPLDIDFKISL